MATRITFIEVGSLVVRESYREVYERLLATNWQGPCEFNVDGDAEDPRVTINPAYVAFFCAAEVDGTE
jgi:hypothetical protein